MRGGRRAVPRRSRSRRRCRVAARSRRTAPASWTSAWSASRSARRTWTSRSSSPTFPFEATCRPAPTPKDPAIKPEVVIHHALFEDGGTNVVDDSVEPAARFQVRGTQLEVRNFSWPVRMPAEATLATPMPRGGRLEGRGTFQVHPSRMDLRVTLADVALSPAQPYLPVGARLSGNVDGEAQISARFAPFSLAIRGNAAVKELGIGDANRQLLTAGRARAAGIDVQWPGASPGTSG